MPSRRHVLGSLATVASVAVAGCTGGDTTAGGDGTTTDQPGTEPPTTRATTQSTTQSTAQSTTSGLPENCRPLPDLDGLPDAPAEWTTDRAESYAMSFERAYKPATDEHVTAVDLVVVTAASETDGGRYVVEMEVTVATAAGSGTQTEQPQDAVEHRARYVLAAERVVRQLRGVPANRVIEERCWRLPDDA